MTVREHFKLHYDEKEGVNNLHAFAPDVHFLDKVKSARWIHWRPLFYECFMFLKESPHIADAELAETFGPAEYLIFVKIMRAGFNRFRLKHPSERVPEIWNRGIGALQRLAKGEPQDQPPKIAS